jgi:hypothetical protein
MFKITFNALNYLRTKTQDFKKQFSEIESYHGMEIQSIERALVKRDNQLMPLKGMYDLQLSNGKLIFSAIAEDITITDLTSLNQEISP